MCGIAGFTWRDDILIRKMLDTLKHRGPDDEGIYTDEKITLGHRRLSILDLTSKGHQPMSTEDNALVIIHNGEIYNYKEIREELKEKGYGFNSNTDTEVILQSYAEWGPECVKKFNGMWAFVIYDKRKNILFMSRDRFGIKPLYYHLTEEGNVIFASEIKAILQYKDMWEPNDLAIFDYLMYNLTDHQDFTFFKDILKLPKAHYLIYNIKNKNFHIKKYWTLRKKEENYSTEEARRKIKEMLESSVKFRLRSDVPVGSCLSGGIDSSSIVAIMAKEIGDKSKISTFSAVYPGFEKNEEEYIDILVKNIGVSNYKISPDHQTLLQDLERYLYHLEEPTRSTSQYSQYNVMKLASRYRYKVLLDGQGSDEIFAGYPYFYGYYLYDLFRNLKWGSVISFIRKCRRKIPNKEWIKYFCFFIAPKIVRRYLLKKRAYYISKNFYEKNINKSIVFDKIINVKSLKDALWVHLNYKLEELLKWEDRNAMAFSIETRVPFLDHRFVEFVFPLPDEYILKDCYTKYILRKAMEKYVSSEVIYRRDKVGFETPEAEWLRQKEVIDFVEKIIYSESFKRRKYWNAKKIEEMWVLHKNRRANYSLHLWKVIFVELWLRMFIEREGD